MKSLRTQFIRSLVPLHNPFSIKELLLASHLAVTYGILFVLWSWFFTMVKPVFRLLFLPWGFSPVGRELLMGFWFQAGVLIPYLVRKPGAAFFGSVVAALVQMPLVPWGVSTILSGIVQGLASEFVFLMARYQNDRLPVLLFAGGLPAFTSFLYEYKPFGYGKYATSVQVAMFITRLISGIVLGGYVPYQIAKSLRKTGVLPPHLFLQKGTSRKSDNPNMGENI